jgi:protein-L-isoaspartate(D-aspartate) O-methyltransferase
MRTCKQFWLLTSAISIAASLTACRPQNVPQQPVSPNGSAADDLGEAVATTGKDPRVKVPDYEALRQLLVKRQLMNRDISDPEVLRAMGSVPRHEFVDESHRGQAYADHPLPIGSGQTISQPYIVALMTQLAEPKSDSVALDVGTGSGYQAAVLAEIVKQVYSIEIVEPLAKQARERLARLGYDNVEVRAGDGYQGWPEHAPFDLIILAAAPDHTPEPLIDQLAVGGKLVLPVGKWRQVLTVIEKKADGSLVTKEIAPVVFVPMTGPGVEDR